MAGHSKWANIKHKKQKEDKRRGKLFSKLSRKIAVAAREGGGDPEMNSDLRMAIQKAKDNNMPNDNIERAIKRGTGNLEGMSYESFVYEGYGPGGVALYLDIMTDNRNRTASEVRHILDKNGGNLGSNGCVAWMFQRKGELVIDLNEFEVGEEDLLLEALEAGAEDLEYGAEEAVVYTDPSNYESAREALEEAGYEFESADLAMVPDNEVTLDKSDAKKMLRLMDQLEDHDDIQDVYSNFNIPEDIRDEIEAEED
ncbi:DNA-binding regulatory protein, YebC/PmpR family [Halanaerobium congolense]|jgi:YebC/PmpR family DNA-binding regulatory protein|uniref:Probable transcriptional regulatory protein SAMN04488598_10227 n=1 Tax=Halanaerobium congolense TaxID=54121 RepID=A0A1G7FTU4_9FIRM|nr:YebC/PmpR family DNA-binding transcriptional regulator [Halanaerobium congolense]PTX16804.1 YebC/PmpR family DNA-binding regulatory protein [Halanaerobium congolense]SDE79249.1 DNA-binding regulatory protein, YebC/PmpR family [Halanaerobium congolense]SDI82468.1 DNA-binding regulatory protein, YebC/PmpR family [Halanaerobium congolense]SES66135.1 DNA-binding regulatory protein, YebC/PmpR family [Halanaerobium congolense]SET51791.1 DNA-binding regulatory protein, YebC/PmpR family [Halanaerob